jgi:hypothetical protein
MMDISYGYLLFGLIGGVLIDILFGDPPNRYHPVSWLGLLISLYIPKHMIDQCTIFIAILTDVAMRSEWVLRETNYAAGIRKPCILLKEQSISIVTELEWTSFSKHNSSVEIFQIMMTAIDRIRQRNQNLLNSPIVGILGIAIASFLAGWILRK